MLYIEYNIHYRACVLSLIYILSTIVHLCFSVHKLEMFSSNQDKVHFGGLVNFLRCIRDKNNLRLKYYDRIYDTPISDLLMQSSINSENQLMLFSDSSWWYCPDTGIITVSYIAFYQVVPIEHCTHVTGPVESEYNSVCTAGLD